MTTLPQKKKYTPAEFLALEEKAETKSEYWNGAIVATAGGSLNRIQITFNAAKALDRQVAGKCRTLPIEIKVWVQKRGKFYYPNITIVCGKPQFYQNRNDTIINPQILSKVLSKSTKAKYRTEKFWSYQLLDSFQEYIFISQDKAAVEKFVRQADGSWRYLAVIGEESVSRLTTIEAALNLQDVYQAVDFELEENL